MLDPDKLEKCPCTLRNVLEIALVTRRQNHFLDACPSCSDGLLLDPTDRQHQSSQTDLASYRHIRTHCLASQQRSQGREHRHTRTRSVLRDFARRNVHVNVAVLKLLRIDSKLHCLRLHQTQCRLLALLHDFAELTGEDQLPAAGELRRFNEENVSSHRRPGQSQNNTGNGGALGHVVLETRRSEDVRNVCYVYLHGGCFTFRDFHRGPPQQTSDLTLQVSAT